MTAQTFEITLAANVSQAIAIDVVKSITLQSGTGPIEVRGDDEDWTRVGVGQGVEAIDGVFRAPLIRSATAQTVVIVTDAKFSGAFDQGQILLSTVSTQEQAEKNEIELHGNTITHSNVSALAAGGQILGASSARRAAIIKVPAGGVTVRIGGIGVAAATGFAVSAGEALNLEGGARIDAISTGVDQPLEILIMSRM